MSSRALVRHFMLFLVLILRCFPCFVMSQGKTTLRESLLGQIISRVKLYMRGFPAKEKGGEATAFSRSRNLFRRVFAEHLKIPPHAKKEVYFGQRQFNFSAPMSSKEKKRARPQISARARKPCSFSFSFLAVFCYRLFFCNLLCREKRICIQHLF